MKNPAAFETCIITKPTQTYGKMRLPLDEAEFGRPPFRRRRPGRPEAGQLGLMHITNLVTCCLLLTWWRLDSNLASALYLQQQPPMIISSQQQAAGGFQMGPEVVQALTQFTAQQIANGGLNGALQASIGGPNQQVTLVNGNNVNANANNQTTATGVASTGAAGQASATAPSASSSNQAASPTTTSTTTMGQFVIKFLHNDSKNQLAYVSITPVNYTNLHEPRIEFRFQSKYPYISLAESAPNNTVVAAVVVSDEDSGPNGETSLAIEQGNELGHFKLVSTPLTNTIQVNGAPLSRLLKPEYNLTIVARDHGSPPKASSSTLVIKLHPTNGGPLYPPPPPPPAQRAPIEPLPSGLKPPVDLMYVGTMLVVMFSAVIILIIIACALVQRPTQKAHKGPPPTRTTSASNSRIVPPTDQCSAYCLTSGYDLSNLNIN